MVKQGDEWLSREMGGSVGRRVAWKGRWVAKFLARLLATAALWIRIQTKYKIGDISKGVTNILKPAK